MPSASRKARCQAEIQPSKRLPRTLAMCRGAGPIPLRAAPAQQEVWLARRRGITRSVEGVANCSKVPSDQGKVKPGRRVLPVISCCIMPCLIDRFFAITSSSAAIILSASWFAAPMACCRLIGSAGTVIDPTCSKFSPCRLPPRLKGVDLVLSESREEDSVNVVWVHDIALEADLANMLIDVTAVQLGSRNRRPPDRRSGDVEKYIARPDLRRREPHVRCVVDIRQVR